MAEYESIHGTRVKYLSSDPTLDSSTEGQVWYNSTSGTNKALVQIQAFSSAGAIGTARYTLGVAGTQTAGLLFAGDTLPGPSALTEEYNGVGWANGGSMSTARRSVGGFGTQTAAVVTGGNPGPSVTTATEEYNGSSWTGGGAIGTGRRNIGSAGILTAGLAIGGFTGTAQSTSVEHYNGTSWTAGGAFPSGVSSNSGMGTQTAALSVGGNPGQQTINFKYDGSSWTALSPTNTVRANTQSGGDSASAVIMGGYAPSVSTATETWDGTNWTTSSATLATAKTQMGTGPVGSGTASFGAGGYTAPGKTATTEEYNSNINTITNAAWSAGNNMNTGRTSTAGFANKDDLVIAGGFISTPSPADADTKNLVEEYNGSSWTAVTAMPTNRASSSGCGASQTSGMVSGGIHPNQTTSVEYDGTNWTSGGDVPAVSRMAAHCGTVPAALRCGGAGNPGPAINQTIEYNGSSWTAVNNMPHAEYGHMLVGTQTAAVFSGGHNAPTKSNLYEYDGTNWSTSPASLVTAINNNAGAAANGTQTAAMWMLGAGGTTAAQIYNGTTVELTASLGTARYNVNCGGGGTSAAAIVGGGDGDTDATEEFVGGTSVATASTLTTS